MSMTAFPQHPVLVVDDDVDLQQSFRHVFRSAGLTNIEQCFDGREVVSLLEKKEFEVVLLDLNMPHVSGQELLPMIVQKQPDVPVIVVTGNQDVRTAVKCMRAGAFDYLVKPVSEDELIATVKRGIEVRDMRQENRLLREHLLAADLNHPEAFAEIVTANKAMFALFRYVEAVAVTPQPILITGETGVGKELIARAIHRLSQRKGEFVPVNISGLDDNMFSDTLFGHVRGAFTGAVDARKGLIEKAAGGTLFLDEIGDLSQTSQVKLLRLVQEREYFPLGSDTPKHTDARIVVATNRNLDLLLQEGKFREDLYFRLRSHHVHVPPLRERLDDLPLLVDHLLAKAATVLGVRKPNPPPALYALLSAYDFPGNVRELEAMCFNAVSTHKSGILSMDTFRQAIGQKGSRVGTGHRQGGMPALAAMFPFDQSRPLPTVEEAEEMLICEALRRTNGNQTLAAELLGITRQTLNRRLKNLKKRQGC
ncbi:MAG: sigma-54 dependent transcriptional regulator [Kiritimatiellae bacterium]|nr:sigma-54 dependent transcriptional regulator [Kiritimatiellia bacterium]